MTVNLFTFVDLYWRLLSTLEHILKKGEDFAASKGVSAEQMLDWKLIDDMQPLRFQLKVVCDFTKAWPSRVAGLPVPAEIGTDLTLAQFREEIAVSKAFLKGLKPEQFVGREDAPLTVKLGTGMEPTLPAARWLTVFATTNLYFHTSTAYGILRSKGVPIGKPDLFSTGL
jgi:uncharacterized protein